MTCFCLPHCAETAEDPEGAFDERLLRDAQQLPDHPEAGGGAAERDRGPGPRRCQANGEHMLLARLAVHQLRTHGCDALVRRSISQLSKSSLSAEFTTSSAQAFWKG